MRKNGHSKMFLRGRDVESVEKKLEKFQDIGKGVYQFRYVARLHEPCGWSEEGWSEEVGVAVAEKRSLRNGCTEEIWIRHTGIVHTKLW